MRVQWLLILICFTSTAAIGANPFARIWESYSIESSPKILVAPSEKQIALLWQHRMELYAVDEFDSHWTRHLIDTGYYGTEEFPVLGSSAYGWVLTDKGEALMPHRDATDGFTAKTGAIQSLQLRLGSKSKHPDLLSRRMPDRWTSSHEERKAFEREKYEVLKAHAQVIRQQRGAELVSPLPESLESIQADPFIIALQDVAPDKDRILVARKDYEPPISLDLVSGERISFPLVKPGRSQPRFQTGRFSPDGQYVLVLFEHGPDDNEGGGFLQLFRADGAFVEEIGEMPPEGFSPRGFHDWLSNGWILFCDGEQLHFARLRE